MATEDNLDEKAWNGEALVNPQDPYWRTVNPRNVHLLFYESDFFDRMSNNQALLNQSGYDEKTRNALFNRRDFEQMVTNMPSGGMEYITITEPHPVAKFEDGFNDPRYEPHGTNGTYVFQKQMRKKAPGRPDEITVLGQYYMIGFVVTQAPSIYDVLTSQFLFTTYQVQNAYQSVLNLPFFSPAQDHYTYFQANTKTGMSHGTRAGTLSRASTEPPDANSQGVSSRGTSSEKTSARATETFLFEALTASMRYGSEFMDENPLVGEPGSFVFSATNTHVQQQNQQKQAQEQAKAAAAMKQAAESEATTAAPTPAKQPLPAVQVPPKKRKKSKAPGSPTSPTVATPVGTSPFSASQP